jgi:hypothetical protein
VKEGIIQWMSGRGWRVTVLDAEKWTGKAYDPTLGPILRPGSSAGPYQGWGERSEDLLPVSPGDINTFFRTGVPRLSQEIIAANIAFIREFGTEEQKEEMRSAFAAGFMLELSQRVFKLDLYPEGDDA